MGLVVNSAPFVALFAKKHETFSCFERLRVALCSTGCLLSTV